MVSSTILPFRREHISPDWIPFLKKNSRNYRMVSSTILAFRREHISPDWIPFLKKNSCNYRMVSSTILPFRREHISPDWIPFLKKKLAVTIVWYLLQNCRLEEHTFHRIESHFWKKTSRNYCIVSSTILPFRREHISPDGIPFLKKTSCNYRMVSSTILTISASTICFLPHIQDSQVTPMLWIRILSGLEWFFPKSIFHNSNLKGRPEFYSRLGTSGGFSHWATSDEEMERDPGKWRRINEMYECDWMNVCML